MFVCLFVVTNFDPKYLRTVKTEWAEIWPVKNYSNSPHSQGVWNLPHKFHLYLILVLHNTQGILSNCVPIRSFWTFFRKSGQLPAQKIQHENFQIFLKKFVCKKLSDFFFDHFCPTFKLLLQALWCGDLLLN